MSRCGTGMPINARLRRNERDSRSAFVLFECSDCSSTLGGDASRSRPVTALDACNRPEAMGIRQPTALGLALFATLCPSADSAKAAGSTLAAEDFMISSADPGIRLFMRNKHPVAMIEFRSQRTLLYVHGATHAASSTFDLKINGESWMDYIARRGYDV